MKDSTIFRVFFPKISYPPVHMLADICPCEKSTIKRLHMYYFAVFTALKSRNLFVSLSICPFPSCLFSCLAVAAPSRPVTARTDSDPPGAASHHVLGWLWLSSLSHSAKTSFSSPSPLTRARVAWASLYHCCYCLFISERGQPTHQHLKYLPEGDCGWMQEGRCWWLPQPFLWSLGSCSCDCWLVKRVHLSTTDLPSLS